MSKLRLYQGQPGTTATAGSSAITTVAVIDAAAVCNPTGAAVTLDAHIVPSGGSASAANKVYHLLSVPAGSQVSLDLLLNQALNAGDVLRFAAGTASAVTVTVSGRRA